MALTKYYMRISSSLYFVFSLLLSISLVGCSSSDNETDVNDNSAATQPDSATPTDQSDATEPTAAAAEPEASAILVEDNNVNGGGFQSDVTISADGQTVYSSADVSGVFKSTDGGLRFENRNEGLRSSKVASLKGSSGGLFRSVDGGETWALTGNGDKAQFAGNHSARNHPVPKGHPRSNGDLIVVDEGSDSATYTDDTVIVGTYNAGVRLFTQGGESEESVVAPKGYVRSVAYNPALPDTAFAAIQFAKGVGNGIYRIDYTNPSAPKSTLEYETPSPEGLSVLENGNVYAAISTDGIVRYNGTSWDLVNTGLSTKNKNRQWTAVTGYVQGDNDVVYAGTNNLGGRQKGKNYSSIWRTEDSGDSWTPLVEADTNVKDKLYGQSHDWWYRTKAFPQAGLGRTNNVVSSIDVVRGASAELVSDDIIYVSGRGGIWKSENGGELWEPAVNNMQATANNGVAVNPNNPNQVVLANTDYVLLESSDRFMNSSISRDKPKGAESRGHDVIFDTKSNELILGVGDRDHNRGGEVFVKSATAVGDPSDSGWTNTKLSSVTASNDGRVRAVTYGYHNGASSTSQTILAAVEEEGVFRYENGTWSKSSGVVIGSTDRSNFVWPDNENSGIVYLLDLSTGLHRSQDGGQSWENIWPSMGFKNNNFFNTGYITADDNNPTTLYLSIQGKKGSPIGTSFKVYRMTEANTGVFGKPGTSGITDITTHSSDSMIERPGPIVIGPDGSLWLTQQQDSKNSINASLFVMENPTDDASFTEVTTNDYRNVAIKPSGIDVSSDGYIYISQNGVGVVKIYRSCHSNNNC